jgi:hypothetical protein
MEDLGMLYGLEVLKMFRGGCSAKIQLSGCKR